ncbi:hypothetical protein ABW19_dt0203002 [Dactylella cylindrospora]|nr:hypothetical protein ABW19_dt0203002 [Dactylella cylindrospora]
MSESRPRILGWQRFCNSQSAFSPRVLADFMQGAIELFVDGDDEVRCTVIETLSCGNGLDHIKQCLNPRFLHQKWLPQLNYMDHVIPVLRMMSDPRIRTHSRTENFSKHIYATLMDPGLIQFWANIMAILDEAITMFPFRVGTQMTGIVRIFLTALDFDPMNYNNPIIRDCVPKLRGHLHRLRARQAGNNSGQLAAPLLEACELLETAVIRVAAERRELPSQAEATEAKQSARIRNYLKNARKVGDGEDLLSVFEVNGETEGEGLAVGGRCNGM